MNLTARRWLLVVSLPLASFACTKPAADDTPDETTGATSTGGPSTTTPTSESSTSPSDTSGPPQDTTAGPESSGGSTEAGTTGEPIELRGACPLETRVGGFEVVLEEDYSAFSGSVADAVVPISVLELVGEDGDCILLRRNNPFCDPLCQPGQTCDFDGTCIPYPANHDVGVVAVSGLVQPVSVDPVPPTFSYFDTSLPNPAVEPGALVELTAAGGDYEAFTLHGYGVSMVEPLAKQTTLSPTRAVEVTWNSTGSEASLLLVMSVDQHGLTPAKLVCETADTGSLTISAEIVAQFLESGVSGYPGADYYLRTVDSVDIEPGCVELVIRSHVHTQLDVAGHTPCDAPNDCPDGQTCDVMNQTCV